MTPMAQYNSMQAQAGLLPAPQVIFPGQVSAAIAAQGGMGAFGALFPSQTYQTAVGTPPIFQGPTGLMASMNPSAPYNPYASANPYSGLSASPRNAPSAYAPYAPSPPPAYAGFQGQSAVPFAPPPPLSAFDTPYGASVSQMQAGQDRSWAMGQGHAGIGARLGADLGFGALGAMAGRRFGAVGAFVGGMAGMLGSEFGGVGQAAQNAYGNFVAAPKLATYGAGMAIENMSQGFVSNGPFMNQRGQGFSHHAAQEAAEGLTSLSGSASFRRETQDRFNQQDVFKITQLSAENGMMGGVGSPAGMTGRVRDIAKSLSAFMELAKEPDIVRAIQTMGSLRSSGLNLQETMSAVQAGRSYARMAGATFQGIAEMGGSMGSQAYQSMGLTQGLGFRTGMANYGIGASSMNQGILNPQMSALVGGAQGLGTLNTMFSGAMLQHPMVTPGAMGSAGGLNADAVRRMMSGESNMFSMTGQGANALSGMASRYGVGGLGMAVAMQPLLQDSLGRMIQSQGTFAGRNMEDRQVLGMARQMGLHGSQGYMTAAMAMGMDRTQALTRATEMNSPSYWNTQRAQLGVEQREARANTDRAEEEDAPSLAGTIYRYTAAGRAARGVRGGIHHLGEYMDRTFLGGGRVDLNGPLSDAEQRGVRRAYGTDSYRQYAARQVAAGHGEGDGLFDRLELGTMASQAAGSTGIAAGLGGLLRLGTDSADDRARQRSDMRGGAAFATDVLSSTRSQQLRASNRANELFGNIGGLQAFGESMSNLSNTYGGQRSLLGATFNGVTRGAAQMVGYGIVDPGNSAGTHTISASEIEQRYRQTMRAQGKTEEEITRLWSTERSNIAAAVGHELNSRGMTPEQRAVWQQTQRTVAGGIGTPGGDREVRDAYTRVMGNAGSEAQAGYRAIFGEAEGLGREGSRQNSRTKSMITALAMTNILATQGDPGTERAQRIRSKMLEGLTPSQRTEVTDRATALADRYRNNRGVLEAARGVMGTGDESTVLERMEGSSTTLTNAIAYRNASTGFAAMKRMGGTLGSALANVDTNDDAAVEEALKQLTPAQLREMRREGSGSADIANMIRSHNFSGVRGVAGRIGQEGERARSEWEESHAHGTRRRMMGGVATLIGGAIDETTGALTGHRFHAADRLRSMASGFLDRMSDNAAVDAITPHSAAERQAMLQGQDSAATQSEAEGTGMGRAGDALLEASRELSNAARQLSNSTILGAVTNLVGSNTPTP